MPRQISAIVDDDIDRTVRLYMRAARSTLATTVRDALVMFVKHERSVNAGVNSRFEQFEAEYFASANVPSLVSHRKPKKKDLQSDAPGTHTQTNK